MVVHTALSPPAARPSSLEDQRACGSVVHAGIIWVLQVIKENFFLQQIRTKKENLWGLDFS